MRLWVTGGAGFIGCNFSRYWLERYPSDSVVNIDSLTYAGDPSNFSNDADSHPDRYRFVHAGIGDYRCIDRLMAELHPDVIVNFAAESHNSRAVLHPRRFFDTNVMGTQTLLDLARKHQVARFHHISTCEVYGDLPLDSCEEFTENHPYRPRTPYNASKAAADHAVRAYFETYRLPVTISNCSNNYGPYQHTEKVIPLFTTHAIDDKPLPLYRNSQNRREWLAVLDHCRAIDLIIRNGRIGETYNIGSGVEQSIEEIADAILAALDKPESLKTYVPDRPGHDRRYLLDSSKIRRELGWEPQVNFESGLRDTVRWYAENREWWTAIRNKTDSHAVQEDAWK
ncbi:MAG: dTDP-glucose 4,6-dehydratase [Candidatus Poribacteria bacterium]|nr:dTDP-glucose 4,6-dehydratase [Candidatus Poribacteria bacterium]